MICKTIPIPGGVAIVCSRRPMRARCATPGCIGVSVALCDFPLTGSKLGKTCDRRMCARCQHSRGRDVDYCPTHARQAALPLARPEEP